MKRQGFKRFLMAVMVCLVAVVPCAAAIVNNSQVAGHVSGVYAGNLYPAYGNYVWVNMTLNTTAKTWTGAAKGTVKNLNFRNLPFFTTKVIAGSIVNIYFNNNTYTGFTVLKNTYAIDNKGNCAWVCSGVYGNFVTNPPAS